MIQFSNLAASTERSLQAAEKNLLVRPALLDPVSKLRVSNPVSLIDTDFEYGPQSSKWETYESVNGYGGFYRSESDAPIGVQRVTLVSGNDNRSELLVVYTTEPHGLKQGDGFVITGTRSITADGAYTVHFVANTTTFSYLASEPQVLGNLQSLTTRLYAARMFNGGSPDIDYVATDGLSPSTLTLSSAVGANPYSVGTAVAIRNTRGRRMIDFSPQTDVQGSTVDETNQKHFIRFTDNRLTREERVIYRAAAGSPPVTGMVDGDTYFVRVGTKTRIFLSDGNNLAILVAMEPGAATGVHTLECQEGTSDGVYVITGKISDTLFTAQAPYRIPKSTVEFSPLGAIIPHASRFRVPGHGMAPGTAVVEYSKGTGAAPVTGLVDGQSYSITYVDQDHFTINGITPGSLVPVAGVHSFVNPAISGQTVRSIRTSVLETSDTITVSGGDINLLSAAKLYDPVRIEVDRDVLHSPVLSIESIDDVTHTLSFASTHTWNKGTRVTYSYFLPDARFKRASTITLYNINPTTGKGNTILNIPSDDYAYLYSKYGNTQFTVDYNGTLFRLTFNTAANNVIRNTTILRLDGSFAQEGDLPVRAPIVVYELLTEVDGYIEPIAELEIGASYYVNAASGNTTSLTLHATRADAMAGTNAIAVTGGADGLGGGSLSVRGEFTLYQQFTQGTGRISSMITTNIGIMIGNYGTNLQGWELASGRYANYEGIYAVKYLLGPGESAMPGFSEGGVYYVRAPGALLVQFFGSFADAVADTSPIALPAGDHSGYVVGLPARLVIDTTVAEVNSASQITVADLSPFSTNNADLVMPTYTTSATRGQVVHRPFDGGVEVIPSPYTGASLVRQTRRYFRYQSGKGIQMSVGVNFSGPSDIILVSADGTIATRSPHRIRPGISVSLAGMIGPDAALWNVQGAVVESVSNERTFKLSATAFAGVSAAYAPGFPRYTVDSWPTGPVVRVGMFDDQNGMFYEYDGSELNAVRRSSIQQLPGEFRVTRGSVAVISSNTNIDFTAIVGVGDRVCIRGMTHTVSEMLASGFNVHPPYRGTSATEVIISLVQDVRVPASEWSVDTCDGSGSAANPSGYNLNIHKMQMAYIDYSWYGAGKIRFGLKGIDGDVFFVHEFVHNNFQDTAYIRSGNLPARYEVVTPHASPTNTDMPLYIPKIMHWGTSVIMDGTSDADKSFFFTVNGRILAFGNGDTVTLQGSFLNGRAYTRLDPSTGSDVSTYIINVPDYNSVKNLRRGTIIASDGVLTEGTRIISIQRLVGNAGGVYVDSRPLVSTSADLIEFTAGDSEGVIPQRIPLVSFRLSPSVDSGVAAGQVGERDLINRMQLMPLSVDILSTHDVEITLLLNGFPVRKLWEAASQPSLAQILYHDGDADSDVLGGTHIFSFRAAGGAVDNTGRRSAAHTSVDVSNLSPLGNSLVGGDDVYPNGPDILTVTATLVDSTNITSTTPFGVSARLSWTESQA